MSNKEDKERVEKLKLLAAINAVSRGHGTDEDRDRVREATARDDNLGTLAQKAQHNHEKGTGTRL